MGQLSPQREQDGEQQVSRAAVRWDEAEARGSLDLLFRSTCLSAPCEEAVLRAQPRQGAEGVMGTLTGMSRPTPCHTSFLHLPWSPGNHRGRDKDISARRG